MAIATASARGGGVAVTGAGSHGPRPLGQFTAELRRLAEGVCEVANQRSFLYVIW